MKAPSVKPVRCAIYTRVSTDHGLDQEFNSLDAQYDAASAYITSQAHAGWALIRSRYDDGGYSGGSTDRPDLQRLLDDIRARKIDVIVVYKVDRLTRSLADFAKLVELFDAHDVSFVSVTQQFNTTTSMGRLEGRSFACSKSTKANRPVRSVGERACYDEQGRGSLLHSPMDEDWDHFFISSFFMVSLDIASSFFMVSLDMASSFFMPSLDMASSFFMPSLDIVS